MRALVTPLAGLLALASFAVGVAALLLDLDQVGRIAGVAWFLWFVVFVSSWFFTADLGPRNRPGPAPRIREDIGCRTVGCLGFWAAIIVVSIVVAWLRRTL